MSSPPSSSCPNVDALKTEEVRDGSRSPSPLKKTVIETRRAEQNRAAQRAFRQRKERYVKELEAKVNSMADWPARMEHLENENEGLKRKINELLAHQEESNKKMFKLEPSPPKSSSSTTSSSTTTTNHLKPVVPAKVVGEKGRVLDDLVSILRTRHRPPIPSHPPPTN
ncbi:hypothetical protein EDC94DRAFT_592664 [Helicostylum pulchrum]|nr:hypothetical protein EDC94DRAFT_592664 [Helicostylum pulchrum]